MWGLPGSYLYHVLIGARLWLPRKCQDAGIEGDGDVNFHLLLVPHRHVQCMDPSVLQGGEGAPHHHDNQVISTVFQHIPSPPWGLGHKGRFCDCGGMGSKMPETLQPLSPWRRLSMAL